MSDNRLPLAISTRVCSSRSDSVWCAFSGAGAGDEVDQFGVDQRLRPGSDRTGDARMVVEEAEKQMTRRVVVGGEHLGETASFVLFVVIFFRIQSESHGHCSFILIFQPLERLRVQFPLPF
jgi:hypothetical protein